MCPHDIPCDIPCGPGMDCSKCCEELAYGGGGRCISVGMIACTARENYVARAAAKECNDRCSDGAYGKKPECEDWEEEDDR